MPFYIRKSISAGPFRFNLSKSGVGLSVGIRGLRVGTGPRGHYVHAGRGGLYYRSSIGRAGQSPKASRPSSPEHFAAPSTQAENYSHPTVDMIEIESGDVMEMADSRFQEVLADLNGRAAKLKMTHAFGGGGLALWLLVWIAAGFSTALPILIVAGIAWAIGGYLDSYRRSSVIYYDLEGDAFQAYQAVVEAFEDLAACNGKWHVAAGGAVRDIHTWKRNAGASHLVAKEATSLGFALPDALKSNVTPPSMQVGKQMIYLLPDVALLRHNGRFGAIAYGDLIIRHQTNRFIEDGVVPRDAQIVDQTWRYVNKKGGPDRRFNNNTVIPICLYESMHLQSASGLNELLEFSKTGIVSPFERAIGALGSILAQARTNSAALPLVAP